MFSFLSRCKKKCYLFSVRYKSFFFLSVVCGCECSANGTHCRLKIAHFCRTHCFCIDVRVHADAFEIHCSKLTSILIKNISSLFIAKLDFQPLSLSRTFFGVHRTVILLSAKLLLVVCWAVLTKHLKQMKIDKNSLSFSSTDYTYTVQFFFFEIKSIQNENRQILRIFLFCFCFEILLFTINSNKYGFFFNFSIFPHNRRMHFISSLTVFLLFIFF